MIDTQHAVETPEGVDLWLRVAGPVARAYAWLLDFLLLVVLWIALVLFVAMLGAVGLGLLLIGLFFISWFYHVAFEVLRAGQTPGKRMMGLRVVHEDGTPVSWGASVLRNFLRVADFLPTFYGIGLIAMLCDTSFRRLGDLAAGTVVVYSDLARVASGQVPDVPPQPPPLALTLEEQGALIAFAQRAPFLTQERAAELAAIPAPLGGGSDARDHLVRIAAWVVRGARP